MQLINVAHAGVISDAPSFSTIGMNILNFLLSVAGVIAIIALVVSGILYFFSAGDEKRMQVAKKSALYAILGIVFAMGSMIAIKIVGQFF